MDCNNMSFKIKANPEKMKPIVDFIGFKKELEAEMESWKKEFDNDKTLQLILSFSIPSDYKIEGMKMVKSMYEYAIKEIDKKIDSLSN